MIGGFALIAYPAVYGNSGITTNPQPFLIGEDLVAQGIMVNHAGVVFQKDLGPRTAEIARKIDAFAPDQTWTKADSVSR
jgi:Protein of unknown function (DUF2950)